MIVLLQVITALCWWLVPADSWTAGFQHRVANRSTCRNVVSPTLDSSAETAPASSEATTAQVLADDPEIRKPERDPRQYRLIRLLPNQLMVLLVCDGSSSGVGVESASVHVKAGHFDDTVPGLARTLLCSL